MKKYFKLLPTLFFLFFCVGIQAQNAFDYFQEKDFDQIFVMLDNEVDIQINRKKQVTSKQKAINILKEKIENFNPLRWELIHRGAADDTGNSYFIARIYNAEDKGLRLFVHLEGEAKSRKITAIKFRKLL